MRWSLKRNAEAPTQLELLSYVRMEQFAARMRSFPVAGDALLRRRVISTYHVSFFKNSTELRRTPVQVPATAN